LLTRLAELPLVSKQAQKKLTVVNAFEVFKLNIWLSSHNKGRHLYGEVEKPTNGFTKNS